MEDLKDRTRNFARQVFRLCRTLPSNREVNVIARQLVRAGMSPGAHFREGLRARSKAEYVSKMNGGLMELEETLYWLEIAEEEGLKPQNEVLPLRTEANELIAIFVSQINKWKEK
jgi:four helix bundle protein